MDNESYEELLDVEETDFHEFKFDDVTVTDDDENAVPVKKKRCKEYTEIGCLNSEKAFEEWLKTTTWIRQIMNCK